MCERKKIDKVLIEVYPNAALVAGKFALCEVLEYILGHHVKYHVAIGELYGVASVIRAVDELCVAERRAGYGLAQPVGPFYIKVIFVAVILHLLQRGIAVCEDPVFGRVE